MRTLKEKILTRLSVYKNRALDFSKRFDPRTLWIYQAEPRNFGDQLNFDLVSNLVDVPVGRVDPKSRKQFPDVFFVVGSVFEHIHSEQSQVWGAGMIGENNFPKTLPKKIHAVRGPLTFERLKTINLDVPEVFGDPALLVPKIYKPNVQKKYRFGVVAHAFDQTLENAWRLRQQGGLWIDVCGGIQYLIDQMMACDFIVSSSLHGLIIADAYGLPNLWVEFSSRVEGNGFKFRDYFLSVRRKETEPLRIAGNESLFDLEKKIKADKPQIDLNPLLKACPFRHHFSSMAKQWL